MSSFKLQKTEIAGSLFGLFAREVERPTDDRALVVMPYRSEPYVLFASSKPRNSDERGEAQLLSLISTSATVNANAKIPESWGEIVVRVSISYQLDRSESQLIRYAKDPYDDRSYVERLVKQTLENLAPPKSPGDLESYRSNILFAVRDAFVSAGSPFSLLEAQCWVEPDKKADIGRIAAEQGVFESIAVELAAALSDTQLDSIRNSLTSRAASNRAFTEQQMKTIQALSDCERLGVAVDEHRRNRVRESYNMAELVALEKYFISLEGADVIRKRCESLVRGAEKFPVSVPQHIIDAVGRERSESVLAQYETEIKAFYELGRLLNDAPPGLIPQATLSAAKMAGDAKAAETLLSAVQAMVGDVQSALYRQKCHDFVKSIGGNEGLALALEEKFVEAKGDVLKAVRLVAIDLFGSRRVEESGLFDLFAPMVGMFHGALSGQSQAANVISAGAIPSIGSGAEGTQKPKFENVED